MSKIILLIYFYFISISAFANNTYLFGQTQIKFINIPQSKLTVSSECVRNNKPIKCQALEKISKISILSLELSQNDNRNKGSIICTKQMNGFVIVGKNIETKNENSFCKLPDQSIIDNGSLVFYARMNDKLSGL